MPDFRIPVLLAAFTLLQVNGQNPCIKGWFGPKCQFKCHCKTSKDCDKDGNCPNNGKCDVYFGPGCQYLDLASSYSDPNKTPSYLTDNDDKTCNPDSQSTSVTVFMTTGFAALWFRITAKYVGVKIFRFTLAINYYFPCDKEVRYVINWTIVDIECEKATFTRVLTINGEVAPYICSLQIFGGRNVALKQFVNQTSKYKSNSMAAKAVDGLTDPKGVCARTNSGPPPQRFTIYFDSPTLLLRARLYNSEDKTIDGFSIQTYNEKGQPVLTYYSKDDFWSKQAVYDVPLQPWEPAVKLDIEVTNYIHLCELEVFGYDICPGLTYGRLCERSINCQPHSRITGRCRVACDEGTWGHRCLQKCSSNCVDGRCEPSTGTCYQCVGERSGYYCGTGASLSLASTLRNTNYFWAFIPIVIIIFATPVVVFFYMGWKKKRNSQSNRRDKETSEEKSQSNREDIGTTEEKSESNREDTETTVPP